jgi:hypothetical protein
MDLEISVVNFLSVGYTKFPWEYQALGETMSSPLRLEERAIMRDLTSVQSDPPLLCYPPLSTFGLVDCYTMQDGCCHAFQITWQQNQAFKIRTLWAFHEQLKIGAEGKLKLFFVSPFHASAYTSRAKENYLKKGENLEIDIVDADDKVILSKEGVALMWDNTEILCAFPKGNNWKNAILSWFRKKTMGSFPPEVSALAAKIPNKKLPEARKLPYFMLAVLL